MQVASFQNGYYTALCNRVGEEECLTFSGESFVCAPDGRVIARAAAGTDDDPLCRTWISRETGRSHARRLFLRDRRPDLYAGWIAPAAGGPMKSVSTRLIGAWRLVSYDTLDHKGRKGKPYAEAVGRLTYDEHGNMSGQVMRPHRARVEVGKGNAQTVRAAYIGYIAVLRIVRGRTGRRERRASRGRRAQSGVGRRQTGAQAAVRGRPPGAERRCARRPGKSSRIR